MEAGKKEYSAAISYRMQIASETNSIFTASADEYESNKSIKVNISRKFAVNNF